MDLAIAKRLTEAGIEPWYAVYVRSGRIKAPVAVFMFREDAEEYLQENSNCDIEDFYPLGYIIAEIEKRGYEVISEARGEALIVRYSEKRWLKPIWTPFKADTRINAVALALLSILEKESDPQ